jgi:hypothetical protein
VNIRHLSESLYERILYFNNNIYCALETSPPQKSLNHPYARYLFVFQIFFCAWETILKSIHKSMLNNSDIKTRNSELLLYYISKFKGRRISHMIYYTIQRPISEEKRIIYSSLLVAIVQHYPTAHIYWISVSFERQNALKWQNARYVQSRATRADISSQAWAEQSKSQALIGLRILKLRFVCV